MYVVQYRMYMKWRWMREILDSLQREFGLEVREPTTEQKTFDENMMREAKAEADRVDAEIQKQYKEGTHATRRGQRFE